MNRGEIIGLLFEVAALVLHYAYRQTHMTILNWLSVIALMIGGEITRRAAFQKKREKENKAKKQEQAETDDHKN